MKSWSERSRIHGLVAALIWIGAFGCAPPVTLGGVIPDPTSTSSTGGESTSTGSGTPSACGVTTLATGLTYPAILTIQGDMLYGMTSDTNDDAMPTGNAVLYRVPLAGGAPVVLATALRDPFGLVTDSTSVYWTSWDGTVKKMPLAGGAVTILATGQETPTHLAINATDLYWGNISSGTLVKAPLAGGSPTVLHDFGGPSQPIRGLVLDASNAYVTLAGGAPTEGSLVKVPLDGSPPVVLASGLTSPHAVAVDAGTVYWTSVYTFDAMMNTLPGGVLSVASAGSGSPATVFPQITPHNLARDAKYLYSSGGELDPQMVNLADASDVIRYPLAGGPPTTIASGVFVDGLVACPGGVCWTDALHGAVMRYEDCSP